MSDFIDACRAGKLSLLFDYVTAGYDVNERGPDGTTALYWSACEGHEQIVAYLLGQNADPDQRVLPSGSCPLHGAADRGHRRCLFLLLKRSVAL